ncbi:MAG: hypothetical protein IJ690_01130 [Clostridia bacterium]|nr:hypothetical protein [Clostridia bacterium]
MTEKQLIMSYVMTFLLALATIYFIHEIIVRIKNKAQKRARQQIKRKSIKIDFCKNLVRNMQQDFIGQRQVIFNELVRM